MKKNIVLFAFIMLSVVTLSAQSKKGKIEILYFKANLCACRAKSCSALENDIKAIVGKNYPDSSVVVTEIKLADDANKALVEKYKAQSQTVIIVKKKKNNEFSSDVSDIVKTYVQDQNKETLEQQLKIKIDEIKKKKK
jgi:hypothetical protein